MFMFSCCVVSFILNLSLMYDILIATNVAQEQDRSILPELEKGEERASAPPSSAAQLDNSPHTILCVFCVRRE